MHRMLLVAGVLLALCGGMGATAASRDDDAAFLRRAQAEYASIIAAQSARGALDDPVMLARVAPIVARLSTTAGEWRADASSWRWEVHVTSDPSVAAFCIAGGKILVGSAFVQRLKLDDAELAMMLAHEMAHALAGHRRARVPVATVDADPAGEQAASDIARGQEDEADRIGILIASRAGWSIASLVGFFDKLAADEPAGTFSASHLSAAARAENARETARRLGESGGR